jgi:hypothetical protein
MRIALAASLLAACTLAAFGQSVTRQAAVDPEAAAKARDQIAAKLAPSARAKLDRAAAAFWKDADAKASPIKLQTAARDAVTSAFPGAQLGAADIDALADYVLAQSSADAEKDLRALAGEMKKIEEQKESLRKQLAASGNEPSLSVSKAAAVTTLRAPSPLPAGATVEEKQKRLGELASLSELGVTRSQAVTEKRAKTFDVLSALMKKLGAASDEALAALK